MSDATSDDKNTAHKPAKFDLSDGISSEDFVALGHGLYRLIIFILKIIFFPLIWVKRMFARLITFLFSPHAERLLTDDEKLLVSSVPIFLGFLGLTTGALFALLAYINNSHNFTSKFQNVKDLLGLIGSLLKGLFDVLGIIWGFIYQNIILGTKDYILKDIFHNTNPLVPFLALAVIGFVGAIVILVLLELQFVQTILKKISEAVNFVVSFPFRLYERIQQGWNNIVKKLGDPVMGGEDMLNSYTNKFYQKSLRLILLFAIITIISGLYIFFTNKTLSAFKDTNSYFFLIAVMLSAGLFAGYPVAYLIIRFLKSLSKDKYEARKVVPTGGAVAKPSATKSEGTTPAKPVTAIPVTQLKGKTAKERAEERRRIREAQRKQAK